MFRTRYGLGQRSLFHVLHAFSLLCPDCGYVQGMGPIAATLLCYYEPEKVYAVLVHLHDTYAMHTIFSPGFPGLLESIYVQERVMERMLPDVYASFVSTWRIVRVCYYSMIHVEEAYDLIDVVHDKVVYHSFCQHNPVPDAIAVMGRVLSRGTRLDGHCRHRYHLGFQE
jgi:Rab-GTPase-TBC domain